MSNEEGMSKEDQHLNLQNTLLLIADLLSQHDLKGFRERVSRAETLSWYFAGPAECIEGNKRLELINKMAGHAEQLVQVAHELKEVVQKSKIS